MSALIFPPADTANEDGLLAIGGNLLPDTILLAYRQGIFPWYNAGDPILWWSPNPRCVLFPENLLIHRSMRPLLRQQRFHFTVNHAFDQVIRNCGAVRRKGESGTWITDEMINAYSTLHQMGWAHSAEVWKEGKLVGGLYGIRIGKVFFGESMFSFIPNASKYAFIRYVEQLRLDGVSLLDCQQHTAHLESLGATCIPRRIFIELLRSLVGE